MPKLSYISPKAAVQASPIHGRGLFAVAPIMKGEIVCVKGGYIFDRQRLRAVAPVLGPAEIQIGRTPVRTQGPSLLVRAWPHFLLGTHGPPVLLF